MTRYAILSAACLLAVPAAAQDPVQVPATEPAGQLPANVIDSEAAPEDFDLARKKVVDCAGEKFVFAWGAGARPTKVTLCSKEGATDEELVTMLDDAANKLEQAGGIADDRRTAIVHQIRAKIAEIKGSAAAAAAAPQAATAAPPTAPPPVARPAVTPVVARPVAPPPARPVLAAKPRLAFECYTPGELGSGGPCTILARDTRLTVKARDALGGGTSLRFVRNGQARAQVALDEMRRGRSVTLTLPKAVCAGVVEAETKIEVVSSGQVVDSIGPYLLRC